MLLVLASDEDYAARALVNRWRVADARLLRCRDLSRAGWAWYSDDSRPALAVVGEDLLEMREIEGMLVRLPAVTERELPHIHPADRSYAAAEMTAFLTSWLSSASFLVVNRPTPTCLLGPNWRHEQWLHAAAHAGLRVPSGRRVIRPGLRGAQASSSQDVFTVTVVGTRCFGPVDDRLAASAVRLAAWAGVELLTIQFNGRGADAEFLQAYLCADLSQAEAADALLERFQPSLMAAAS